MNGSIIENIYVFNIRNRQSDYAKCLKIISLIESDKKEIMNSEINPLFKDINIDIIFSKYNRSIGMSKKDKVIWIEKNYAKNEVIKPLNNEIFISSLEKINQKNIIRYYYFRIHSFIEEDDIVNFFYYELANQMRWFPKERALAFIVPACDMKSISGKGIPYLKAESKTINNSNQFGRFSDFCTLIEHENIFGVWCSSTGEILYSNLLNLNRTNSIPKSFIPLFVVNNNSYNEITKYKIVFDINIKKDNNIFIEWLDGFTKIVQHTGIKQYFLKFSNNKLSAIFSNRIKGKMKREMLITALSEAINENSGITYLQYLLFSLILTSNNIIVDKIISELEYCSKQQDIKPIKNIFNGLFIDLFDFSDAVSQLMENIINHSINHFGLATARLTKDINGKQLVQVLIADANDQTDIINTFISNKVKCPNYLAENRKNIIVTDMLNSISNSTYWKKRDKIANAFYKYRTEYPQYCHGLVKFANDITALNGKAFYCSSSNYYCRKGNSWKTDEDFFNVDYIIPGTQTIFEFKEKTNYNEYNKTQRVHYPVYEEFAKYLDCPKNPYIITPLKYEIFDQHDKDNLIEKYTNYWSNINFSNDTLSLCVDFSKFNSDISHYEVLWKGLIKFIIENANNREIKYFAFINVTLDMLTSLYSALNTQRMCSYFGNISIQLNCGLFVNLKDYNPYKDVLSKLSNEIFPFQLINNGESESVFEKSIGEYASKNLIHKSGEEHGYCLYDTHMRLGSKVHLETFYELSILFKKQDIAIQIAFVLCKQLIDMNILDKHKRNQNLIIYGYEAYSKSIVFCMTEIIKKYFELFNIKIDVEFVLYQVDRSVGLKTTREKPYFSKKDFEKNITELKNYDWVLIVPISTTLTTFDKMLNKIKNSYGIKEDKIKAKLTAFWVVDKEKSIDSKGDFYPSSIEKKYWKKANTISKTIFVNDSSNSIFRYFVYKSSKWNVPIKCKKCFPKKALDEIPLLETDPSSTVPEQQYYVKYETKNNMVFDTINDERILLFKDCVSYGHINRNGNHYQFYFNLPKYFQNSKFKIKEWLKCIKNKLSDINNKQVIIVSPQQNTDVEFSLYVSNFLCEGNAITIAIDSNKHFRSNIEAEYDDIKNIILSTSKENCYFIYVDTAITSGQGFNRIRSLMSNIAYEKPQFFSFDAVILLTNRLSNSSKQQYIKNFDNFFSFVNIEVPSIRTFGDSCICCKLENDCRELYKTAATKEISAYYECKMLKNFAVDFNSFDEIDNNSKGFLRLVLSHMTSQLLSNICHNNVEIEKNKQNYFDTFKYVFESCLNYKNQENIIQKVINDLPFNEVNKIIYAINNSIKVFSRPFYTYDFIEKSVIMDFLIILSETIIEYSYIEGKNICYNQNIEECLNSVLKNTKKVYLNKNKKFIEFFVAKIFELYEGNATLLCEFLYGCVLKCLMNLQSNYLLRFDTINKIFIFLKKSDESIYKNFYNHYLIYMISEIKHSYDSTKSIRLEKELTKGKINFIAFKNLWSSPDKIDDDYEKYFLTEFIYPLIVENTSIIYKELYILEENNINVNEENISEYKELYEFLDVKRKSYNNYELIKVLNELYNNSKSSKGGSEYFTTLKETIVKMINIIIGVNKNVSINVFANKTFDNKYYNHIYGVTDDDLDEGIIAEFSQKLNNNSLNKFGYSISKVSNNIEIIICFDNNKKELEQQKYKYDLNHKSSKKIDIDPVYLFLSIDSSIKDYYKYLIIVRYILTFRHSIISVIEKDFSNNMMQEKFNTRIAAKLLTVDKAGTHMNHSEFMALQYYLRLMPNDYTSFKKTNETTEWLLLYNYTNRRIARLYNKMLSVKYLMQEAELLNGQDEIYVAGDYLPQYALINFSETLENKNDSRAEYFRVINRVIDFTVEDKSIDNIEEFKNAVSNINFIHFCIENNKNKTSSYKTNMYYSAENFFVCCLLDFCYSTIKNSCMLFDFSLTGDTGIGGLYNELTSINKRISVNIKIEFNSNYIFNNKKYGYLILENKNAINKETESGMSLDTIKWYFETLWLLYQGDDKNQQLPEVFYGYENNCFNLKLPILESEEIDE